ncbi:MAG: hypothetical protein EAZ42_12260 [Verrucomicrobia bacterium]|nr:MAG: hypothetical protein EAZ42_12260 [Verrucomicrobiota bacterium]
MRHWLRSPSFWLAMWLLWFCALWFFSSMPHPPSPELPLTFADKIYHFLYFTVGSIFLTGFIYQLNHRQASWKWIAGSVLGLLAICGAIDEYHQSFVSGRSGNDLYDWLANMVGAVAGFSIFYALRRRIKWNS